MQRWGQLKPAHSYAHSQLGILYGWLNEHTKAVGAYKRAIELEPDTWHYRYNLGLAYKRLGQREHALAAFQAALDRCSNEPEGLREIKMQIGICQRMP